MLYCWLIESLQISLKFLFVLVNDGKYIPNLIQICLYHWLGSRNNLQDTARWSTPWFPSWFIPSNLLLDASRGIAFCSTCPRMRQGTWSPLPMVRWWQARKLAPRAHHWRMAYEFPCVGDIVWDVAAFWPCYPDWWLVESVGKSRAFFGQEANMVIAME